MSEQSGMMMPLHAAWKDPSLPPGWYDTLPFTYLCQKTMLGEIILSIFKSSMFVTPVSIAQRPGRLLMAPYKT